MNIIKKYAWCFWVGFGLSAFCDTHFYEWEFYAFMVPLILLVNLKDYKNND